MKALAAGGVITAALLWACACAVERSALPPKTREDIRIALTRAAFILLVPSLTTLFQVNTQVIEMIDAVKAAA